jgi:SP family myo-inositol transporter-like MFS transporter 13
MLADVLFTTGAALMFAAPSIQLLMMGRIVVGLGVGIAAQIVPMYLSEVSPKEQRGTVVAANVFSITFGQFLSSLICLFLAPNWRLMLGLAGVPSFL